MTDTEHLAEVVLVAVRTATAPILKRIAELEAQTAVPGPAGERGAEGPTGAPGPVGPRGEKGDQGLTGEHGLTGERGLTGDAGPRGEQGPIGERGQDGPQGIAGRDGLPGVQGPVGEKGVNGLDGKDGAAGQDGRDGTLEQLHLCRVDERTICFMRADGTPIEGGTVRLAALLYRGVWVEGKAYEQGDVVTWAGSAWVARENTAEKPGTGATAWQLAVKAGRDGREGKQGPAGPSGAKGEKGDPGRDYR